MAVTRDFNAGMLALSDAQLRDYVPGAFATAPRGDVSSRYGFVNTYSVIEAMREHGFVPTHARSYLKRAEDNKGFAKHMIRFRKAGDNVKRLMVGDVVPQFILINSHDRSSQFHVLGGLFRLVCANGLMVSHGSNVQPVVVRHTVSAVDGVLDATGQLIKHQKLVFEHVDEMKGTKLDEKQARLFAEQALALRPTRAGSIDSTLLLQPRRSEDAGMDVWSVYNRCQENLMRGGLAGVTSNNRAVITRGVDSINADIQINAGLWRLAMDTIEQARASSARAVARSKGARKAAPAQAPQAPAGAAQAEAATTPATAA